MAVNERWLILLHNIKVKVKLPLCLISYHDMNTYGGSGGVAPCRLTSAVDGDEW
jgi:hypothetical protein